MKHLYLIGPVTGKPNDNRKAFNRARIRLQAEGYAVDVPHDFIAKGTSWPNAMLVSINQLTKNAPVPAEPTRYVPIYDGVAMLDGYETSRGATIEHAMARAAGIPCRPWREYLSPAQGAAALAADGALQPIFAPAC